MGYQESWLYVKPQRHFDKLIRASEKAEQRCMIILACTMQQRAGDGRFYPPRVRRQRDLPLKWRSPATE